MEQPSKDEICPRIPVEINEDREVVETDSLSFPWPVNDEGYFLVKIEDGKICCGFVRIIIGNTEKKHKMILELRGTNPEKMIREIAKRNICDLKSMGYIASELIFAKNCLDNNRKYIQR